MDIALEKNDAKAGKLEGPINTSSVEAMLKSMDL